MAQATGHLGGYDHDGFQRMTLDARSMPNSSIVKERRSADSALRRPSNGWVIAVRTLWAMVGEEPEALDRTCCSSGMARYYFRQDYP